MQKFYLVLITILAVFTLQAQDRVKVMSYNLLNYGNVTSYCTTSNNDMNTKNGYIATIVDYVQPDILAVVEMGSADFAHKRLLDSALNVNGGIQYAKAQKVNTAGSSIISLVYYNTQKFGVADVVSLQNTVRDVILVRLFYKSPNLAVTKDTAFINCIVAHLKAGNGSAERGTRTQMVNQALGYLSNKYPAGNYLFMGDLNLYSSNEGAYQALLNYSNTAYRFYDPINTPGSWNNNSTYAAVHTQSTHSSSNGCASGGGLDDRFDFILVSHDILNSNKHIVYVNNSYKTIGNDGKHFNKSINSGTNNSVPANVLTALYNNSDHLPVVLELDLDNTIAGVSDVEKESGLRVYFENPVHESLNLYISSRSERDVQVELYDISGRVLARKEERISENSIVRFDLSGMASGLYFVRITGEGNKLLYSAKVVK
jgi:endonuclease/exonuclease/phosphatase family metal-dependent hydrolase